MTVNQNAADSTLDIVLTEVGGFGYFQFYTFLLICSLKVLTAFSTVNYMISANTLDYRCKISECDIGANNREIQFDQPWLHNAIPSSNDKIDNCHRYAPKNDNIVDENGQCSQDMFDTSTKIECTEFVYGSDERNVQTEFNIHCTDSYKLAIIGTAGNLGRFITLPIFGLLADRYGRLPGFLIGITLASFFALIKSFSVNYYMYLILEFLECSSCSVAITASYILSIELLNSKNRVLGNTIISLAFPTGEILFGLVAMHVHDFRTLIRILHIPGLFVFIYFWFIPESIRWLCSMGRVDEATAILKRIAKVNRKTLSPESIEMLKSHYNTEVGALNEPIGNKNEENEKSDSIFRSLGMIFKSKTFSSRFLICCYQWAACNLSFYGLGLTALHIPGANRYISFIIVMASEIPGSILSQILLPRMKRRILMFLMMFLGAISIIATSFIPEEYSTVVLVSFILGKVSISCVSVSLYVVIMEQWPTNIRNTVVNSCSMFGRIGSMVAPLTMILVTYSTSIPNLIFGGTAILSSILALCSPETFKKKLPDTMEEAKNL